MRQAIRKSLSLLCVFGWTGLASAADWPQWRGPDRSGVAAESPPLAEAWPSGGPRLLWRTESLMNGGKTTGPSSPVVAGGRVYLYGNWLAADAAGGAFDAVACLNAASGAVLWHSEFPVADRHAEVRAQGSTPCISNGRLYLVGRKRAYCLDTSNGKVLWQQPIETSSGWLACSFAIVDGVAIMIC